MEVSQTPPISMSPEMEAQARKMKKKKSLAFKTFLNNTNQSENKIVLGNISDHDQNYQEHISLNCCVCHIEQEIGCKKCEFCKDIACVDHLRKKRKNKEIGKFVRICDNCEDSYLYQKYMKFQMKVQDSLLAQQAIITAMHSDLSEIVNSKKTKIILLKNKRGQIQRQHKEFFNKLMYTENELNGKLEKLENKFKELQLMQKNLQMLENSLPRSLDDDYKSLNEQNERITKDLVKYEKQCNDTIQMRCKRQKQIYEEYYQWQQNQKMKKQSQDKDCIIF